MYAFRKPFAAASYANATFLGTDIELKTALVIGQVLGYTLSTAGDASVLRCKKQ